MGLSESATLPLLNRQEMASLSVISAEAIISDSRVQLGHTSPFCNTGRQCGEPEQFIMLHISGPWVHNDHSSRCALKPQ